MPKLYVSCNCIAFQNAWLCLKIFRLFLEVSSGYNIFSYHQKFISVVCSPTTETQPRLHVTVESTHDYIDYIGVRTNSSFVGSLPFSFYSLFVLIRSDKRESDFLLYYEWCILIVLNQLTEITEFWFVGCDDVRFISSRELINIDHPSS